MMKDKESDRYLFKEWRFWLLLLSFIGFSIAFIVTGHSVPGGILVLFLTVVVIGLAIKIDNDTQKKAKK